MIKKNILFIHSLLKRMGRDRDCGSGVNHVGGKFLSNMSIRGKLLVGYACLFSFAFLMASVIIYWQVNTTLAKNIETQLQNSTTTIKNMIKTSADISIKSYLRAVADANRDILKNYYGQYKQGLITEEEAKRRSREVLLSQRIARTGYLYCVDSNGIATVHWNSGVENKLFDKFPFVQKQMRLKEGYLTYQWKNPGEKEKQEKALYMVYFEPWDWIISATSYRSEFIDLLNVDDIRKGVLQQRFGLSGYCFIFTGKGDIIAHPELKGNSRDITDPYLRATSERIRTQKTGRLKYEWQNAGEKSPRKKLVILNYIPEFDWIVGSSGYIEEFYAPLYRIGKIIIAIIAFTMVLVLFFTFWISSALTFPLRSIIGGFSKGATGDFSARLNLSSRDEIGLLAYYFNIFMEKLQEYNRSLQDEIKSHKISAEARRKSEERYRSLAENTPDIIYETDRDLKITYLNKTGFVLTGYTPEDMKEGLSIGDILTEGDFGTLMMTMQEGKSLLATYKIRKKDGDYLVGENNAGVIFEDGGPVGLRGSIRDVTEKMELEKKIQQVQKMETIGNLAGGLAHDFNNVLAGITSTLSIMRHKMKHAEGLSRENLDKYLDLMEASGQRAIKIVRHLLTLSRKDESNLIPMDITMTVAHVVEVCRNTFEKSVEIVVNVPPEPAIVTADATQIEQVLLNLCVNAGHAMTIMRPQDDPPGGKLFLSLEKIHPDAYFRSTHPEAGEIDYWRIAVQDNGVGMDRSTCSRVFEPFYTTKEKGKGSGLGLSMVYTIVLRHRGFIDACSEPGIGSTFNVYLPVVYNTAVEKISEMDIAVTHGEGLILIVDDEEVLRETASSILISCGYDVITADNGEEGLELFRRRSSEIRAVLLDLVMPKMSGDTVFLEMRKIDPNVKVLITSGFTQDDRITRVRGKGLNGFIQKPYTLKGLSMAMAKLFDHSSEKNE